MDITTDGMWLVITTQSCIRKIKKKHFGNDYFTLLKNPALFTELEKKAIHRLFLQLLAKMDYSSSKLFQKAKIEGFDESLTLESIEHFKNKGYINDEAFEKKSRLKKIKKGFACTLFKETSCEALELQTVALKKLIEKKKKLLLSSDIKERQRAYRFFIMRGFSMNTIYTLLNKDD